MALVIKNFFNVSKDDVFAKKFNIIIGISLGNKYFTKENIREYLFWAIENTKEKVAVLIPDKIHAINYEVRSGYKKERADAKAKREGEKIENAVNSIFTELDPNKRRLIKILKWADLDTEEYKRMTKIMHSEFGKKSQFKNEIIAIVKESIGSAALNNTDYEKLATYVLEELPFLIGGVKIAGILYDLQPYPGISKIDYLTVALQEGTKFPEISNKLGIKNKMRHIDAHVQLYG